MSDVVSMQFEKQLIELLKNDTNLSQTTKDNLKKLESKSNPYQQELLVRWNNTKFPHFNIETIIQLNMLHQQNVKATNINRENQRKWLIQNGQDQQAALIQDLPDDSIINRNSCVLKDSSKTMGWNPNEKKFVLIENTEKVSLDSHQQDIERCVYSKSINIPKSLFNILAKGEILGYSNNQFGEIFLLFIQQHLSAHYTSAMSFSLDTNALFQHLVSLIDTSSEIKKVRKALSEVTRRPGDILADPVLKTKALTATLLWMQNPAETMSVVTRKAEKAAIRAIFCLLEAKTKQQLSVWKRRQNEMKINTTLNQTLEAANNFENVKGFELVSEKTVSQDFSDIDITVHSFFTRNNMRPPRSRSQSKPAPSRQSSASSKGSKQSSNSSSPYDSNRGHKNVASASPNFRKKNGKAEAWEGNDRERGRERTKKNQRQPKPGSYSNEDKGRIGYDKDFIPNSCAKCASTKHRSKECRRYPFYYDRPCKHCEANSLTLYHPPEFCRFKDSRYRTPRQSESPKSFRKSTSPKNTFFDNLKNMEKN